MKVLGTSLKVAIVVQVAVLGPLGASCASEPARRDSPLVEESHARTDDEILYDAVLDVFAEKGLKVHLEDAERGLVLTSWTEVNRELRHRWVARVIRSNVGLVLTVDSKYERRDRSTKDPIWVDADDAYTVEEKRRDEQRMGGAIQHRFKKLRD